MAVDAGATGDPLSAPDDPELGESIEEAESPLRMAALSGILILIALMGLVAYLGVGTYQSHQKDKQRDALIEAGRQTAVNLTTIDWQQADADVQRILASATGTFHDDFVQRSQPFVDVVKQTKSKSVGTVTDAGLESFSGDQGQVLVTVSVTTTNAEANDPTPKNWRMRLSVGKVGDEQKVSNVEFVQ